MSTHILLIDDDPVQRRLLRHAVERIGHVAHMAENGRQGLEALSRLGDKVSVIILDLMMPVMDGWQFRVAQKADPKLSSIPVIAVSADRTAKAAAIDADVYLAKPVDLERLFALLRVWLPSIERLPA